MWEDYINFLESSVSNFFTEKRYNYRSEFLGKQEFKGTRMPLFGYCVYLEV